MKLTERDHALIASTLTKYFTPEQIRRSGLDQRRPNRAFRTQLAELDFNFCCQFYLPEHFNTPNAPMHDEFAQDAQTLLGGSGKRYYAVAWPRDHGKTTWGNLGLPIWTTLFKKRRYPLLLADSQDQSKGYLATVKDELDNNERILEDFGELHGPKWQEDHIETSNGCCLEALGTRMKIRGRKFRQHRPDLLIFDDLENLVTVQSARMRELTREWFFKSALKAGGPDMIAVVIGTLLHYDALLYHVLRNPQFRSRKYSAVISWAKAQERWAIWQSILMNPAMAEQEEITERYAREYYEEHLAEMDAGAKVLWEERYPYYSLMVVRAVEGAASFSSELQNDPISEEDRLFGHIGHFRREWRDGQTWLIPLGRGVMVPQSECAFFGFCDPSLGKDAKADPSAIIVLAKAPTGQTFTLEADIQKRQPSAIVHDIVEWARIYPFVRFGVESQSFQVLLGEDVRDASEAANLYLDIVPVSQSHNKQLRIQSLQAPLQNEYLLLEEGKQAILHQQLRDNPSAAHDDGPDALEGAWKLARAWEGIDSPDMATGETHQYGTSSRDVPHIRPDEYAEHEREPLQCPLCFGRGCEYCDGKGFTMEKVQEWYPKIVL